jgi:hypothetical protein
MKGLEPSTFCMASGRLQKPEHSLSLQMYVFLRRCSSSRPRSFVPMRAGSRSECVVSRGGVARERLLVRKPDTRIMIPLRFGSTAPFVGSGGPERGDISAHDRADESVDRGRARSGRPRCSRGCGPEPPDRGLRGSERRWLQPRRRSRGSALRSRTFRSAGRAARASRARGRGLCGGQNGRSGSCHELGRNARAWLAHTR